MPDHASQLGAVAKRLEQAADRLKAQSAPATVAPASSGRCEPDPAPPTGPTVGVCQPVDLSMTLTRLGEAGDEVHRARQRLAYIAARLRSAA